VIALARRHVARSPAARDLSSNTASFIRSSTVRRTSLIA
jgi:hypothetical protein